MRGADNEGFLDQHRLSHSLDRLSTTLSVTPGPALARS